MTEIPHIKVKPLDTKDRRRAAFNLLTGGELQPEDLEFLRTQFVEKGSIDVWDIVGTTIARALADGVNFESTDLDI
jgi:hypothetical protein